MNDLRDYKKIILVRRSVLACSRDPEKEKKSVPLHGQAIEVKSIKEA